MVVRLKKSLNNVMKSILTQKINKVADGFVTVSETDQFTDADYQKQIKIDLESFSAINLSLDIKYREIIYEYFKELMDIASLKSSDGQLNYFKYGFDSTV